MARRTTRQKLQYHARKLEEHLDRMVSDLASMEEVAKGGSPFLNDAIPSMTVMIEEVRKTIKAFFREL